MAPLPQIAPMLKPAPIETRLDTYAQVLITFWDQRKDILT